ncbi:MAG: F0F1 ATP synthase subunit A [Candidatus Pacebacteria bacterium]|nr:F0F1 ATP synthase subunit A [Candidatus Paceibacterota bacterium]
MAGNIHISISAEEVFRVGPLIVTNSMITSTFVSIILVLIAFQIYRVFRNPKKVPSGLQNFVELIIEGINSFVLGVVKDEQKARKFAPLFLSFFIIIMFNNWFGLFPGVGTIFVNRMFPSQEQFEQVQEQPVNQEQLEDRAQELDLEEDGHQQEVDGHAPQQMVESDHEPAAADHQEESGAQHGDSHGTRVHLLRPGTADLNTTLALAIISVVSIQLVGYSFLGLSYFKKFINFSNPINAFIGVLEIISETAKIMSFAFRLFGNIFAGEVLLAVISSLVPVIGPIPFFFLEMFVGFIQALVFSMLTLVFYDMSSVSHDGH